MRLNDMKAVGGAGGSGGGGGGAGLGGGLFIGSMGHVTLEDTASPLTALSAARAAATAPLPKGTAATNSMAAAVAVASVAMAGELG